MPRRRIVQSAAEAAAKRILRDSAMFRGEVASGAGVDNFT
jgi:hypothetical protein